MRFFRWLLEIFTLPHDFFPSECPSCGLGPIDVEGIRGSDGEIHDCFVCHSCDHCW